MSILCLYLSLPFNHSILISKTFIAFLLDDVQMNFEFVMLCRMLVRFVFFPHCIFFVSHTCTWPFRLICCVHFYTDKFYWRWSRGLLSALSIIHPFLVCLSNELKLLMWCANTLNQSILSTNYEIWIPKMCGEKATDWIEEMKYRFGIVRTSNVGRSAYN